MPGGTGEENARLRSCQVGRVRRMHIYEMPVLKPAARVRPSAAKRANANDCCNSRVRGVG
eukprot:9048564-Pyramimonas_sp.AAC.1